MTQEELDEIIAAHGKWLQHEDGGVKADLCGADLCGADLYEANLREANLREADLRGAYLCGADLYGADLRRANLREADLRGADLHGAYLCGADLNEADLYGAYLCEADLYEADLREANLREADLRGAYLCGAYLHEKIIQVGPIGSRRDYTIYNATHDVVQCGCWCDRKGGTLEAFALRVDEVYPQGSKYGDEYRRLIAYLRTVREAEVSGTDTSAHR